jgi:hypothetical protein
MVIWMENKSYDTVVGSSAAPYLNNTVKAQCGLAASYGALTHPSLPNYLSATSGRTYAYAPWNTDCSPQPSFCSTGAMNIYRQVADSGHRWRGYAESMPSRCAALTTSTYAVRHNPPAYYRDLSCATDDVPMGTTTAGHLSSDIAAGLPSYSSVSPNLCHDMHDCSVSTGDRWLASWIPKIAAGPDFRGGRLAVFIVWDEGAGSGNTASHVPCFVLSAYTLPGTVSLMGYNHYSLLRTSEEIVGVGLLGNAAVATSLRAAFRL